MWDAISTHWDRGVDVATLIVALFAVAVSAGLFVRRKRTMKELIYVEQERDDLRKKNAQLGVRLDKIDPERFIDQLDAAYNAAKFDEAARLAEAFTFAQSEAFGRAAEVLTEQRILDSEKHGMVAAQEALRFAEIGLAASPDSKRLKELKSLAKVRRDGINRGEPVETLNWEGMSDIELNGLSQMLMERGELTLAEVAARRSVQLAAARTGMKSENFLGALSQHLFCLTFNPHETHMLGSQLVTENLALSDQAIDLAKTLFGPASFSFVQQLGGKASYLGSLGETENAETLFAEAIEIAEDNSGIDLWDRLLAKLYNDYGSMLLGESARIDENGVNVGRNRLQDAEGLIERALKISCPTGRYTSMDQASALDSLSKIKFGLRKDNEAQALMDQALSLFVALAPEGHPYRVDVETNHPIFSELLCQENASSGTPQK